MTSACRSALLENMLGSVIGLAIESVLGVNQWCYVRHSTDLRKDNGHNIRTAISRIVHYLI